MIEWAHVKAPATKPIPIVNLGWYFFITKTWSLRLSMSAARFIEEVVQIFVFDFNKY